jgi:hypothetical protein
MVSEKSRFSDLASKFWKRWNAMIVPKNRDIMAPLPGLISNQVYEGFAQLYELRAFMEYDGNNGMNAQC